MFSLQLPIELQIPMTNETFSNSSIPNLHLSDVTEKTNHDKLLLDSMSHLSAILPFFILDQNCVPYPRKYLERLLTEFYDHVMMEDSGSTIED